jgi:hypothetical protein
VKPNGEDQETNDEELLDANAIHVYVDSFHYCIVGLARACAHSADDLDDERTKVKQDEDCCEK